jgi:hypothetical protein
MDCDAPDTVLDRSAHQCRRPALPSANAWWQVISGAAVGVGVGLLIARIDPPAR